MRALVTGASGFVGRHLTAALQVSGWDCVAGGSSHEGAEFLPLDLGDVDTLRAGLDLSQPDVVFHLAGQAAVPQALADPMATYDVNALGTARLLQAIREYQRAGSHAPRVVFASSAEVYGRRNPAELPLHESLAPQPVNPYGASKAAAEALLLGEAGSYGLDVVIARTFNYIGPGQSDRFVVASFAAQLARIAAGDTRPLLVGNLDARRDFLDVRDGVVAYVELARHGMPGQAYNVCGGAPTSIREILAELIAIARVPVEVREDPARMRPSDTPIYYGSNEKLRDAVGWKPEISLPRSLRDIYEDARARTAVG
jgi:GDP-4-dehydro-6-deoxy-D-mannose reductase